MNTTKKLPPENWQEAIAKLTEIMGQVLLEVRANTEGLQRVEQRLERAEEDAAGRYVDLRKRIDRVDERMDTLNDAGFQATRAWCRTRNSRPARSA